jgi:hypothetical protein
MKLLCKSDIIVANDIIQSSKTISNMMEDLLNTDDPILIPEEYHAVLTTDLQSKECILILLQLLNALKDQHSDENIAKTREGIESKARELINERISLLTLYNFLHVDEEHINTLAKDIGIMLEQFDEYVEILYDILILIVNNFPSLSLDKRYQHVGISNDVMNNPRRYESAYYRRKYNSHVDNSEYINAGNPYVLEYCIEAMINNNRNTGSNKTYIDITGLMADCFGI